MHYLISVIMNRWGEYASESQVLKRRIFEAPDPLGFGHPPIFEQVNGFLLVVDWDGELILGGKAFSKPFGFALRDGALYVVTWGGEDILVLRGKEVVGRIQHPWFNHLHSIDLTPRGLLVTSSGTDLLAEIDEHGRILWDFFLFEHGYDREPYRLARVFTRSRSYNHLYIPSNLNMHVNSAILVDEDTVLATVFRSNELVRIHRRTGAIEVVLRDLHHPHAIRRRDGGGYLFSDTEGGAVILLDHELRREGVIPIPTPWIQDAVLVGDRLMAIGNQKMVANAAQADLEANATTTAGVLELTLDGIVQKRLDLGSEHRLYMVEPIAREDALALADAWKSPAFDASFAQWEVSMKALSRP